MRQATRKNANKAAVSRVGIIPAPTKGWSASTTPMEAEEGTAILLDNWFCEATSIRPRKGYTAHVTGIAAEVQTLMSYVSGTTNKMFAAGDAKVYDVTSAGVLGAAQNLISAVTVSKWQWTNFATTGGQYLYIVNGTDVPRHYSGSAWAAPAITGYATPQDFIHVTSHKSRLWFCCKNSTTVYYLPPDAIAGAVTAFPLGSQLKMGGYIMAAANWSVDAGEGMDDMIAFWSSEGEVLIYAGTNPSIDYGLVGRYVTAPPIGRRCMGSIGGDVAMISEDGILALSTVMRVDRLEAKNKALTAQVVDEYLKMVKQCKAIFGWQMVTFPQASMALLNIPDASEDAKAWQFAYNVSTKAWSRFKGMDASCWVYHQGNIFFGTPSGGVYRAEYGGSDAGSNISLKCLPAFNHMGSQGMTKHVKEIQPIYSTDLTSVNFGTACAVNFVTPTSSAGSGEGTASGIFTWDTSFWDGADVWGGLDNYDSWTGVGNIGYVISPYTTADIDADANPDFDFSLIGWHVLYEPGGISFSN